MLTNAKAELMNIINSYQIVVKGFEPIGILQPNGEYDLFNSNTYDALLKFLDRDYDDVTNTKQFNLIGTLYGYSNGLPIWLTREDFEGLEGWKVNRLPKFFHDNPWSPNEHSITLKEY